MRKHGEKFPHRLIWKYTKNLYYYCVPFVPQPNPTLSLFVLKQHQIEWIELKFYTFPIHEAFEDATQKLSTNLERVEKILFNDPICFRISICNDEL